ALEALHQQFFGPRIVGQSFLGEHTDFDLDCPFVVINQRRYGIKPAHSDAGIDLDLRSHAGCAVQNALLKGLRGPAGDVFDRHALLQRRDPFDGTELGPFLRRATVDDPRFVEVDMALDEARTGKPAFGIVDLRFHGKARLYRYDTTVGDADVREFVGR